MISFFPRSLRLRITILFALVFGIVSGSAGFVTYMHLERDLFENIDQDLKKNSSYICSIISHSRGEHISWELISSVIHDEMDVSNFTHIVQVVRSGDDSLVVNSRKDFPRFTFIATSLPDNPCDVTLDSLTMRVNKSRAGAYSVYVGSPIFLVHHALEEIRNTYFIFLPLALVLASLAVYFIINRALKPITIAARTAEKISSQNLGERLPPPKVEDEVGELVHTLNRMIARLDNAFTQMTQFTADAAHELHTPLTILRGELEVTLRKKTNLEESSIRLLQSNLDEVNRLISIVESLFTLARLDAKKLSVEFALVELDILLNELFEKATVLAEPKRITIFLTRNDPIVLNADTYRLIQLIINLLTNAIRYTPEGGTIELSSIRNGSHAFVSVKDTGIGIPQPDIEKIFNRFYRVDKARSREMGGSGLGLAIVKWIVELHHGSIRVESEVGKGSLFEVSLPID